MATLAGIGAARMARRRRRFVAQRGGGADVTRDAAVAVLITGVVKGPRGPDAEVGAAVGVATFALGGAGRNVGGNFKIRAPGIAADVTGIAGERR